MKRGMIGLAVWALAAPAFAHTLTERIEYQDGEAVLEGYLARDQHLEAPAPGVLVVHEWKGLNAYAERRAEQLAGLGYVAFAVDMYGKGVRAKDHEEAAHLSGLYRNDRQLMRRRILTALATLRRQPLVDAARIAAIGYCFGGTTVLELARSGADVLGVASFHGGLQAPMPTRAGEVRAKVIVFHGADDRFIPSEEVAAFVQEMQAAHADYRLIQYPGAVHSFTVPEAGDDPSAGMAYNESADKASWKELEEFLGELFRTSQSMRAGGQHQTALHDG
ncbi:MAG: dienelactone hydrolase family protein [Candidatus Omnitrophica bacterium]|nr:dienelactone hydrolase family protein [Candidatus Omnitrophota bacterium]